MKSLFSAVVCLLLATPGLSEAQESEAFPAIARTLPPPGSHLPTEAQRREHARQMAALENILPDHTHHADAGVYLEAVRRAYAHGEFYGAEAHTVASAALATAARRFEALARNEIPWRKERGLSVLGFRSALDGALQPYGLEVPAALDLSQPVPLYVWLHGRGDKKTDLYFIRERERSGSPFAFADGITLHPFGRHCVGFKSAGEIDVLEAVDAVKKHYPIDASRIVLLGFSMGGAGAWHLGAHYADRWALVHAGAGFAETARYNRLAPADYPPPVEQTLWTLYDVPNYARNFLNLPVVAYSGEDDKQIQAARVMEAALKREGHALYHVIGPKMGHKYHPESIREIKTWIHDQLEAQAKTPRRSWHWQTRTLRYPGYGPWEITGLQKHYADSRLDAVREDSGQFTVTTQNITAFRHREAGHRALTIDGQVLAAGQPPHFAREADGNWRRGTLPGLRKRPGLQGPIDDAFLGSTLLVTAPQSPRENTRNRVDAWTAHEQEHFEKRWAALFRGQTRKRTLAELKPDDAAKHHLVHFGTPQTNPAVKSILERLPIQWTAEGIHIGDRRWGSERHVLLLIYPNPDQPDRYVVLNSGPTFREGHDRTNSLQNPKLGDWAVIDIREPPNGLTPGKVVASGFFNEQWQLD